MERKEETLRRIMARSTKPRRKKTRKEKNHEENEK